MVGFISFGAVSTHGSPGGGPSGLDIELVFAGTAPLWTGLEAPVLSPPSQSSGLLHPRPQEAPL